MVVLYTPFIIHVDVTLFKVLRDRDKKGLWPFTPSYL